MENIRQFLHLEYSSQKMIEAELRKKLREDLTPEQVGEYEVQLMNVADKIKYIRELLFEEFDFRS